MLELSWPAKLSWHAATRAAPEPSRDCDDTLQCFSYEAAQQLRRRRGREGRTARLL